MGNAASFLSVLKINYTILVQLMDTDTKGNGAQQLLVTAGTRNGDSASTRWVNMSVRVQNLRFCRVWLAEQSDVLSSATLGGKVCACSNFMRSILMGRSLKGSRF